MSDTENSVAQLDADAVVQQLAEIVQTLSPVELANAGIIVKKVTSTATDLRKFGVFLKGSTTIVVEIALHYEDPVGATDE